MKILIKNGHLINPSNPQAEGRYDILVENETVSRISQNIHAKAAKIIDAKGMYVLPGLIDVHSHLREPGREDEETVYTGSVSAVSGGFTSVCCMPNTTPPLDSKVAVRFIVDRARDAKCEVLPIGAITVKREGRELAPYGEMMQEGVVGFSDDGDCVMDSLVMRRALEYSKMHKKPVISHSEDKNLSRNGVMNEGALSTRMGLRGIPTQAESIMVNRDIALAHLTGGRLHLAHISTEESVGAVRKAKKANQNITCEVTVHHLFLTEDAVNGYNANAKMMPPLRTERDIRALIKGLKDGTIDCIVTDHAPHTEEEKESGFDNAPFGVIGFETALSLAMELQESGLTSGQVISLFTSGPARVLGIDRGVIKEGKRADIAIFNPVVEWIYRKEDILSKSKNSPFIGRKMKGMVVTTIYKGRIVFSR
jgi:dihydroorotase